MKKPYIYKGRHIENIGRIYVDDILINDDNSPGDLTSFKSKVDSLQANFQANLANNRITSRSKVFGIEFDITNNNPACTRIADAAKLKNDFTIGNTFQLNNGINDFDNIYPWCDIKLCNVKIVNGKKVVIYQDEAGFALDGSNGYNVMVEIPKFYSMRERIGNVERWYVSGTQKGGFNIEPAFLVDGVEKDFVYVGAYDAAAETGTGTGVFSYTNAKPKVQTKLQDYITAYDAAGYNSYDLAIFLMLQKLMVIEFGTRHIKQYMAGICRLNFGGVACTNTATGNTIIVPITSSNSNRMNYFRIGHQAGIASNANIAQSSGYRNITNITYNAGKTEATITFDGEPISITTGSTKVYGIYQKTGRADGITYHTGREDGENYTAAFKWRYIENVWGNVWKKCAGIRLKELKYYFTFNPSKYADADVTNWNKLTYDAPNQPYLYDDGQNRAWIVKQGFDATDRLINLPTIVGATNGGGAGLYFDGAFYSQYDVDRNGNTLPLTAEYESVVGGAWDHHLGGGPFTIRMYILPDNVEYLYGNRLVCR